MKRRTPMEKAILYMRILDRAERQARRLGLLGARRAPTATRIALELARERNSEMLSRAWSGWTPR